MTNPPTSGAPAPALAPPAALAPAPAPAPVHAGGSPAPVWPAGAHPPAGVPQGGYAVPAPGGYAVPAPGGYPGQPVAVFRAPGPVTPDGLPIAAFGERLVAYLVDSMIQGGVVSIIAIPVYLLVVIGVLHSGNADDATVVEVFAGLLVFELVVYGLFSYLYHVEWVRRSGSTVGKRLMKLRIVSLDGAATPPDRGTLTKRWAAQYVVGLVPFYGYLDGFWQLWDQPYRQCLHDKWPRTAVVKVSA